jgi:hypothetical protein
MSEGGRIPIDGASKSGDCARDARQQAASHNQHRQRSRAQ